MTFLNTYNKTTFAGMTIFRTIILIIALLTASNLFSQSLSVFDIDTTNFPTMKAKFYATDKDNNQILNFSPSDFEIKENGIPRTVVRDITERKQAEEALKKYTEELEIANTDLKRFNSASVGREIRMIELKKQINGLLEELGRPEKYEVVE
ncbi:MAG: putative sensor protein [Ignavibacteria bacterium]|nr:putative sensor protein [Ignavibacteria bacterium]